LIMLPLVSRVETTIVALDDKMLKPRVPPKSTVPDACPPAGVPPDNVAEFPLTVTSPVMSNSAALVGNPDVATPGSRRMVGLELVLNVIAPKVVIDPAFPSYTEVPSKLTGSAGAAAGTMNSPCGGTEPVDVNEEPVSVTV